MPNPIYLLSTLLSNISVESLSLSVSKICVDANELLSNISVEALPLFSSALSTLTGESSRRKIGLKCSSHIHFKAII